MAGNIISELQARIREDMNNYADHVSTGDCQDWAEYQKNTGIIQGLARAERHLLDLEEIQEKSEMGEIRGTA